MTGRTMRQRTGLRHEGEGVLRGQKEKPPILKEEEEEKDAQVVLPPRKLREKHGEKRGARRTSKTGGKGKEGKRTAWVSFLFFPS